MNITINYEVLKNTPQDIIIRGDEVYFQHILSELCHNALIYCKSGGIVSINSKIKEGFLEISIEDNGIGITPENQSKVFDRFFRVDSYIDYSIPGIGLGLCVVKMLCDKMGYSIKLESKLGEFTRVTLGNLKIIIADNERTGDR
ncbi:MAG: hypothetical protein A2355_08370 [Spirochaetes bacterium RIFOXYB1_FULL_32_8]|nr:MAG: hypothetical protein A2355_08370 [Spirochaetes bacterium RIFOXYB1_FULL_32_8]